MPEKNLEIEVKKLTKRNKSITDAVKRMRMIQKVRDTSKEPALRNAHVALAKKQENKVDRLLKN